MSGKGELNDWNATDYDEGHGFVHEYGADLLALLDPRSGERVLDLGCGTGHLTADVAETVGSDGTVLGIDRAAEMVERARETYPDLPFVRADARKFGTGETFDAVFSNAALHWIPDADQDAVLETVRDVLGPDGRFVAEMGGTGNVDRIVGATLAELRERGYDADHPWYFPSVGEYAARLETHSFEVRYVRLFDRPTELENGADGLREWLTVFGDGLFADVDDDERDDIVRSVEDRLRESLFDGEAWTADYRRLRFAAVRE